MNKKLEQFYLDIAYPDYKKKAPLPPDLLEMTIEYLVVVKREQGWYNNKQIEWEVNWVNGQKYGEERSWYGSGNLHTQIHWINGQKHGVQKEWFENGQLCYEVNWVNGRLHGTEKYWYKNGELEHQINWVNGYTRILTNIREVF